MRSVKESINFSVRILSYFWFTFALRGFVVSAVDFPVCLSWINIYLKMKSLTATLLCMSPLFPHRANNLQPAQLPPTRKHFVEMSRNNGVRLSQSSPAFTFSVCCTTKQVLALFLICNAGLFRLNRTRATTLRALDWGGTCFLNLSNP